MGIAQQYKQVAAQVRHECERVGRAPDSVTLLAVSKTVGLSGVEQAIEANADQFGENRPDQLVQKAQAFPNEKWHFIGNIQSRQIGKIVQNAYLIHSLYEKKHAAKINDAAANIGKVQSVLLEVNVSGEQSKSGVSPEELADLVRFCAGLPNLRIKGLMTMAPQGNLDVARHCFSGLRELFENTKAKMDTQRIQDFCELSMGMSEDWQVAIEEGSTIVRIGRAIFSDDFA
ncbi:YggS family pyridoxal phosphate-dependent enzyme [Adlercreutzia sp. ZJ154]|uniref:YggS family pyridoxal phosphate-dependent enzyme n=1 Tax=Adlercreutzia sp. ZJ154 TaxID=2709790 RepID=UPI0013E9A26A|nr:YggS family pyridoxal phosphate-dependent enzyme [Adlercreutzia sp. ZJ154]